MVVPGSQRPGVLIAEDDRATRLFLQRILDGWGYLAAVAADGEEAWALLNELETPILLTDWEIPRLDGPALCRRIRQRTGGAYTYVILLTALDHKADLVAALEAGADDFVSKPFDQAELKVRLEVACRVVRLEEELREKNRQLEEINLQLAQMATTDPLMGIGNRRSFEHAANRIHSLCRRKRLPYGVLMIDVDRFKAYNDRYGHPAGDIVLASVASAIRSHARAEDEVFRYGGEEIVALLHLKGDHANETALAAERLRAAVQKLSIEHLGNEDGVITVSIGGAVFDPDMLMDPSWASIVDRADRGLYEAKRAGRNRVQMWTFQAGKVVIREASAGSDPTQG